MSRRRRRRWWRRMKRRKAAAWFSGGAAGVERGGGGGGSSRRGASVPCPPSGTGSTAGSLWREPGELGCCFSSPRNCVEHTQCRHIISWEIQVRPKPIRTSPRGSFPAGRRATRNHGGNRCPSAEHAW